jgi:hypothetical protein
MNYFYIIYNMKKLFFIVSMFFIISSCSKTEVLNFPPPQVLTKLNSPLYKIGDSALGGKIAYILQQGDSGYDANIQHGLIAAISDQTSAIRWHNGTNKITGAKGIVIGTGFANTNSIISAQGETTTSYAAGLARAYKGGGYDDWFLPSKDELNKLYINKVIIGGFVNNNYWSSSEKDFEFAYKLNFTNGDQNANNKVNVFYVRAIRAF